MGVMEWDVAIIGGGAAGLAAAVAAAEAGARVCVLEASDRIGRPILASGNGRCNFSNARIEAAQYHNAAFVADVLAVFEQTVRTDTKLNARATQARSSQRMPHSRRADHDDQVGALGMPECPNGVVAFFQQHGLAWREEAEGRLYPLANKASAVLDVLRAALDARAVEVRCNARVERLEPCFGKRGSFTLRLEGSTTVRARAVVVASGGATARTLLPDAFSYTTTRPVLGPIATDARFVRRLDNIRAKGTVARERQGRMLACERGEIMFRSYGISGIAAFNLSRHMQPGDVLQINLLGQLPGVQGCVAAAHGEPSTAGTGGSEYAHRADASAKASASAAFAGANAFMRRRADDLRAVYGESLTCAEALRGLVLPSVANVVAEYAGVRMDAVLDDAALDALAGALTNFRISACGIGDARVCQVHRGGFAVESFAPQTLEALRQPGLHVVGEALDVDAPCGGYNLHWAFATGILAGRAAALGGAARRKAKDAR